MSEERVLLRLKRARERLLEVGSSLKTWDTDGYEPHFLGRGRFRVLQTKPFDPAWELSLFEAVQHARGALDNAIAYIAAANGRGPERHRGSFPIQSTEDGYRKAKSDALRGLPAPVKKLIEQLQPFGAGLEHPLVLLAWVSNWEKHRTGTPAAVMLRDSGLIVTNLTQNVMHIFDASRGRPLRPAGGVALGDPSGQVFELFTPEQAQDIERLLIEMDGRGDHVELSWILRAAVGFGDEGVLWPEIETALNHVERVVIPQLVPFM